jgi:pimeloyl-ACP methyl ester carboxylesterase
MTRSLLLVISLACFDPKLQAQDPTMFRDIFYDRVTIDKNVIYSDNKVPSVNKKFYKADIYMPTGHCILKRPLIIWLHGGAFKFGSKNSVGTRLWSENFSRRGYVCAAINYPLYKRNPLFKAKSFYKGCYEALQHLNQAVAFFKRNADKYGIDTNIIILAGNSAGAMIALQYAYSSNSELEKLMDPSEKNPYYTIEPPRNVKAVVNFWGSIFNKEWLKNACIPIVSVHGKKDKLVPIGNKKKSMSGSYVIHKQADSLFIPNRLKIYDYHAHELHTRFHPFKASRATKRRWVEAGQFAAEFLYQELFENPVLVTNQSPLSFLKHDNQTTLEIAVRTKD